MTDEADMDRRSEQIARVLALLPAKLGDATALAVQGQVPQANEEIAEI